MADPIRDPLLVEQHPQERETDHGQHRHERTRADEKCECRSAGQTEDGVQRLSGPEPGRIHIHVGPGEYLLTKGRMEVRGGRNQGGATALASGYGYEACNARHDKTFFPVASEFYMTFLGPLQFIHPDGSPRAVVGWAQAQELWKAQMAGVKKSAPRRKAATPAKAPVARRRSA